jgi:serine/threonine protein kinase
LKNLARQGWGSKPDFPISVLICKKIAEALSNAWEKEHITHQNLRPGNASILNNGEILIHDLGISDFLINEENLISNGFDIWDFRYSSSEFLNTGINSPSNDIYSLGGILHFLATGGHHPFEDAKSKNDTDILSPEKYGLSIPPEILTLMRRLMEPQADKRPGWKETISLFDKLSKIYIHAKSAPMRVAMPDDSKLTTGLHMIQGAAPGNFRKTVNTETRRSDVKKMTDIEYKETDTIAKPIMKKPKMYFKQKQTPFSSPRPQVKLPIAQLTIAAVIFICALGFGI